MALEEQQRALIGELQMALIELQRYQLTRGAVRGSSRAVDGSRGATEGTRGAEYSSGGATEGYRGAI